MRFSAYFDCILNEKKKFSYRNNDISCTHATPRGIFLKMCNLMRLDESFHQT